MPLVEAKLAVPTGIMGVVPGRVELFNTAWVVSAVEVNLWGWYLGGLNFLVQHEYILSKFMRMVPAALPFVIFHEEKVPAQFIRLITIYFNISRYL